MNNLKQSIKTCIKESILQSKLLPNIIDPKIKAARSAIQNLSTQDSQNEAAGFLKFLFHINHGKENAVTLKRIITELNNIPPNQLKQSIKDYYQNNLTHISGFQKQLQNIQPPIPQSTIQSINSKEIQTFLKSDPVTQEIYANKIFPLINQSTIENIFLNQSTL